MADIKITELPQATSVSDSDELIIQQPSGTKRAGIADLPVGSPLSAGDGIDITNDIVTNTKPMNYEVTGSVPSPTPLNADQLQGHPASYFATKNDLSLTQTNLADSETSPSTHSYSIGQYLVYNGQLYKVKTAISVGENLVIGTNIENINVGNELEVLNSLIKTVQTSVTVDATGRFVLPVSIVKILSVSILNTAYTVVPRYLDNSQTICYVKNINDMSQSTTSGTFSISYTYLTN